ncbi:MAG: hypothetical protein RLZZ393_623 [Pseudomonadota bacterium]
MLEILDLHVWRGERHVLRGLALRLPEGQALQLLWPNGAGKTSLLRAVAGLLPLESGRILWQGEDVAADREAFSADLAFLGHELALKGDLTAAENLVYSVSLRQRIGRADVMAALDEVGLSRRADTPVRQMSAGQQRRVALARLGLWRARLWLLDEPAANLDPAGQRQVVAALERHLATGGCALISTHQPLALQPALTRLWQQPGEPA